jgi:DNA repair exonuclease SbcCD ATPase subunit
MGQNLKNFNTTFSKNTKELSDTLDKVNESYRGQAAVLQSIKDLRINEIATANITIYDKLKDSTQELGDVTQHISEYSEQLSKLGKYLKNSEKYLTQVKELNEKLDEGEERMKTIERLGEFFETELQQIQNRKSEMTKAVGVVDDALQEALIKMQENVGRQFSELEKSSALQQDILQEKLKETTALVEELKNLTAVKASLDKMEKSAEKTANEQNKRLDTLISSINILTSEVKKSSSVNIGFNSTGTPVVTKKMPKWAKVLIIIGGSLVSLTCLLVIASIVLKILQSINLI